jgi:ABC-2 type transport system ATP-binding protein
VGRVITLENVTKRYGAFTAVDDVSFTAQPGRVTGFLGPNGAGKSTSMRVMVGLTPPNGGRATIGGHLYSQIPNPARHVGVLLDASAQHAGRTGREVLRISADTMGVGPKRVEEMLELVGLSGSEAKRRVRNYSLGMRQRLGIANAFLGDPSVLILDEPVNGLDPAGIHWMRGLLRQFAAQGSGDGGFRSEAEPIDIGRAAAAAGVVLVELKPAEGAGLEEMFLQLTSDDARESITAEGVQV